MTETTTGAAAPADVMSFDGEPRRFLGILTKGALLQLPTFGFYRFWLITETRRHLWGHTRLGRDAFEYTGRAKELLVGFLIAAAVLVPIYVVYAILGLIAEEAQALASLPLIALFWVFGHFAIYRARAYKVSRTHYRGLRLSMSGSGLAYAVRAILWDLAVVLTLGLAYPWRAASLERYKMRHTNFGTLPGGFLGTGGDLFRRGVRYWLAGLVVVGLVWFAAGAVFGSGWHWAIAAAFPVTFVLYPLLAAVRIRWQIDGTHFGGLRFSSALGTRGVFWIYVRAGLAMLGFLIVASLLGGGIAFAAGLTEGIEDASVAGFVGIGLIYLAVLLGLGVLKRHLIDRALWAKAANTTRAENLHVLDGVAAAGARAGSLGEGFADALDVSGGL